MVRRGGIQSSAIPEIISRSKMLCALGGDKASFSSPGYSCSINCSGDIPLKSDVGTVSLTPSYHFSVRSGLALHGIKILVHPLPSSAVSPDAL